VQNFSQRLVARGPLIKLRLTARMTTSSLTNIGYGAAGAAAASSSFDRVELRRMGRQKMGQSAPVAPAAYANIQKSF
jgi:hypothetical protein